MKYMCFYLETKHYIKVKFAKYIVHQFHNKSFEKYERPVLI